MHLGLAAFAEFLTRCDGARLTVVGAGPEERRWRRRAERLGLGKQVDWLPWQTRERLAALYLQHDLFLLPSLRDSGGMVVLEALSHGLPVVCFAVGGPGVVVDESCGRVVRTAGRSEAAVVEAMAAALRELCRDTRLCERLSEGALRRATAFRWAEQVRRLYPPEGSVAEGLTET